MKQLCILGLFIFVLLSGCCQRYQVYELMEMKKQSNDVREIEKEAVDSTRQEEFIQRVLMDTKTGKMYYFKNSQYLETVTP